MLPSILARELQESVRMFLRATFPKTTLLFRRSNGRTMVEDFLAEPVPEPLATRTFSGKFMVRVPPQLHRHLAVQAAESGVSLNRLVAHKLPL